MSQPQPQPRHLTNTVTMPAASSGASVPSTSGPLSHLDAGASRSLQTDTIAIPINVGRCGANSNSSDGGRGHGHGREHDMSNFAMPMAVSTIHSNMNSSISGTMGNNPTLAPPTNRPSSASTTSSTLSMAHPFTVVPPISHSPAQQQPPPQQAQQQQQQQQILLNLAMTLQQSLKQNQQSNTPPAALNSSSALGLLVRQIQEQQLQHAQIPSFQPPANGTVCTPCTTSTTNNANGRATSTHTTAGNRNSARQRLRPFKTTLIPCHARGMPMDHNLKTAYFAITDQTKHGEELICSYLECRDRGIKFRWCTVCMAVVASRNFRNRHSHCDSNFGGDVRLHSSADGVTRGNSSGVAITGTTSNVNKRRSQPVVAKPPPLTQAPTKTGSNTGAGRTPLTAAALQRMMPIIPYGQAGPPNEVSVFDKPCEVSLIGTASSDSSYGNGPSTPRCNRSDRTGNHSMVPASSSASLDTNSAMDQNNSSKDGSGNNSSSNTSDSMVRPNAASRQSGRPSNIEGQTGPVSRASDSGSGSDSNAASTISGSLSNINKGGIVEEEWLRLLDNRPSLDEHDAVSSWLMKVLAVSERVLSAEERGLIAADSTAGTNGSTTSSSLPSQQQDETRSGETSDDPTSSSTSEEMCAPSSEEPTDSNQSAEDDDDDDCGNESEDKNGNENETEDENEKIQSYRTVHSAPTNRQSGIRKRKRDRVQTSMEGETRTG